MKIGVRAHDFGRRTPMELAKAIKEAGFETVQLALTKAIEGIESFEEITEQRLLEVERGFSSQQVDISILGCYIEPSLAHRDERMQQVAYFLDGLTYAKQLGIPIVGTETTHFDPSDENEGRREEAYQNLLDSVLRMVEKAESLDVWVGIETVAEHTLNQPAITRRLLDDVRSDHLKIIMDPVNLILSNTWEKQEDIYREFFHLVGDEIAVFHAKDIVFEHGKKIWRNIGAGVVAYSMIFDWLRVHKPEISILREEAKMDGYASDLAALEQWMI